MRDETAHDPRSKPQTNPETEERSSQNVTASTYHRPRYVISPPERPLNTPPYSRVTCRLAAYPVMRMPRDSGAIVVHSADFAPDGAFVGFTGLWDPFLPSRTVTDGTLAVQLVAPRHGEGDHHRADVGLWVLRNATWHRLGTWPDAGPGWPHLIAPFLHAAQIPADHADPSHSIPVNTETTDAGR